MKILETRKRSAGFTYRLYRRDDGTTLATYEVPAAVLRAIGMSKIEAYIEKFQRGEMRYQRSAALRAAVAKRKGISASVVGRQLNITEARVRQIRKEL